MDPYEERKYLSPLDKAQDEPPVAVEASIENLTIDTEQEVVTNKPLIPVDSLLEHISELRKQIIKALVVFILFFIVVFSTINFWFPYVTRGHSLIILGPLEVVKFYMTISTTLALGLSIPFFCSLSLEFC